MKETPVGRFRRWVLLVPFIAILDVPFYNRLTPALFGLPFFYWYQLVWILIAAVLIFLLHRWERREGGDLS